MPDFSAIPNEAAGLHSTFDSYRPFSGIVSCDLVGLHSTFVEDVLILGHGGIGNIIVLSKVLSRGTLKENHGSRVYLVVDLKTPPTQTKSIMSTTNDSLPSPLMPGRSSGSLTSDGIVTLVFGTLAVLLAIASIWQAYRLATRQGKSQICSETMNEPC